MLRIGYRKIRALRSSGRRCCHLDTRWHVYPPITEVKEDWILAIHERGRENGISRAQWITDLAFDLSPIAQLES
jgi:hypothetical protein